MKRIFDNIQRGAFVALWVILVLEFLHGQTYNERYIFEQAVNFSGIVQVNDTLILFGKNAVDFPPFPTKPVVAKILTNGHFLSYENLVGDSLLNYAPYGGRTIMQRGNKVILSGGAGGFFSNTYGMVTMIENYSLKWIKTYDSSNFNTGFGFLSSLILSDNSLMLFGFEFHNNTGDVGILVHTDSSGVEKWRKEFHDPEVSYRLWASILETDTTIVLGFGLKDDNQEHWHSMLMRIDTAGNELNRWMNDTEGTYEPKRILRTEDGGYLYIGKAFKEYGSTTGLPLTQGYICKLDSEWNKEWERKLGFRGKTTFHNVIELEDGDFVAVGNVLDTFQAADRYYRKGWMVKFDIDGNILWEQNPYRPETVESYLFDVVELPDGSLVSCGVSNNLQADSFPQRGWLVRVNANGCMDWGCFTGLNDYVPPDVSPYQLAPNPASDYFRVSVPEDAESLGLSSGIESIRVYDISGRGVFREEYPKGMTSIEMDASEWMSGIYFVVVNERWVEKVVIN